MNRTELSRELARREKLDPADAERLLNEFLTLVMETLDSGECVMIRNFGKFEVREREPTLRRNPKTGEEIKVPKKRAVLFHPAPALKGYVNGGTED